MARLLATKSTHVSSLPRAWSNRSALRHSFTNVSCTRSCAAASFPSITIPKP